MSGSFTCYVKILKLIITEPLKEQIRIAEYHSNRIKTTEEEEDSNKVIGVIRNEIEKVETNFMEEFVIFKHPIIRLIISM